MTNDKSVAWHSRPSTADYRPSHVRHLVLVLACGASFFAYLHRYAWGFVKADIQAEFGWDLETLGWFDSLFIGAYGLGQIPSGIICDWWGARAVLGTILILWPLALGGTTLATGTASMGMARLVFGAAQAGVYPVLSKVSKNWFPLSIRTLAQGLIATLFGRGGAGVSFLLVGTVLMGWLGLSWREALWLLIAVGIGWGALFVWLFRNTPSEHPWSNPAEAELIAAGDPSAAQSRGSRLNWSKALANRNVRWFLVPNFTSLFAEVVFIFWLPYYLRTAKGVDLAAAGWLASLPFFAGALGGPVSGLIQGWLAHRTGSRRWARSSVGFASKFLAMSFMLMVPATESAYVAVGLLLVVKFFGDWEQAVIWGTNTDLGGRNAATMLGLTNSVGALSGVIAGPVYARVISWFSSGAEPTPAGWNALFVLISMAYLISAVSWLRIDCTAQLDTATSESAPAASPGASNGSCL